MIGTTLAYFEIQSLLGAGGMGEVYRARDTRLGRAVALKVLPPAFAQDPERISRFEREARVLASLNHASIATLFGIEKADGRHLLVMELVEGPTLAERIAKGPLPIAEALTIAHRIAEALEAAHERGVVHRDLKPANVKIPGDGKVKVLDFGLAKALATSPSAVDALSPTISVGRGTYAGVILGTAAYMSPEQAKGLDTDPRTDVFAFGWPAIRTWQRCPRTSARSCTISCAGVSRRIRSGDGRRLGTCASSSTRSSPIRTARRLPQRVMNARRYGNACCLRSRQA